MARKRDVDPARWTEDEHLGLSWGADHFYVGLRNFTDDEGRVEWTPRQLWARICPRPDVSLADVEGWMGEIAEANLYHPYVVASRTYAWCDVRRLGYVSHPQKSVLPAPEESGTAQSIPERSGTITNDPERSALPLTGSVTGTGSVCLTAHAREAADPFLDEVTDPRPLSEWQQTFAEACRGLSPPRSEFEIAAHLGDVEAVAGEAVAGGVEREVVHEALRLLAAKAKIVPRRLSIEIAEVREKRRAADRPNAVSEALRNVPKASELLASRQRWAQA